MQNSQAALSEREYLTILSSLQFLTGAPPDRNLAAKKHKQIPCGGLAGWAVRFPPVTIHAQHSSAQASALSSAQHP